MKILVISNTPWNTNNSFGNSFSNIFDDIDGLEFANIYCKSGFIDSKKVKKSFQITEKSLIKNLFDRTIPSGMEVASTNQTQLQATENKILNFASKTRYRIFFLIRDLIWKIGNWKSMELRRFIDDFKPDVIFQPIYFSSYINDIVMYCKGYCNVPMIGYVTDDCYTLKQFSLSPVFWIERFWKRNKVKRTVNQCDLLYVISKLQKEEYEKIFKIPCKILTKYADFSESSQIKTKYNVPLQLLFTGNIGTNRWKSLAIIAKALAEVNTEQIKAQLCIYTATPLTKKMQNALNVGDSSKLMGCVPSSDIEALQENADILVHVEAMDIKNKLAVRHSFSTKLVDYFKSARPILAFGPKDVASISHLVYNQCAIVADNSSELVKELKEAINDHELLNDLAKRGYACGKKHHNNSMMQEMLLNDFKSVVGDGK